MENLKRPRFSSFLKELTSSQGDTFLNKSLKSSLVCVSGWHTQTQWSGSWPTNYSSMQLTSWRTPGRSLRILGKAPPSVHLSWVKLDGKRPNEFCTTRTLNAEHSVQWQMQSWWRFDYKWNWQYNVYVRLIPLEHSPRLGNENKFENNNNNNQ